MHRLLAALALLLVLVAAPASAQGADPSIPPTSGFDIGQCVSALPKPGCGDEPQASGDRGGAAQVALFGIMTAAMATIGVVIAVSTRRHTAARADDMARRAGDPGRAGATGDAVVGRGGVDRG